MESQALRQLVSKIFGDKETMEEFVKNPESVLSRYTLTGQEKTAVINTHARLGLVTGDSVQLDEVFQPNVMWL